MISAAIISSRSTVVVPNLSGLTSSQAISALSAAELTVGSTSTTTSGANSSNTGTVYSQSVTAGTEVERYSSVGYVTYYYESPTPTTTTTTTTTASPTTTTTTSAPPSECCSGPYDYGSGPCHYVCVDCATGAYIRSYDTC